MGIGLCIVVIVVGAILAFALEVEFAGIDMDVLGIIVMLLGIVWLVWTLQILGPRERVTRAVRVRRAPRTRKVYDETTTRRVYDDDPPPI
ncbi:MAG: DUF6458 family protein [Sporichthyaceae bacterium]|nr:DUF6458 family protein [Sporichthyaceae bacterium]